MKSIDFPYFVGVFMIINIFNTNCVPINMCAGSNERSNVFQIASSETLTESIPRLLQKFQLFIRNLGEFISILNERGLRGDQHLLEAVTSSESLDGFPDLDLQPAEGDVDEQLLKDYHILLTVWPFVEHMYLIEKDSDRQLYISFVNGLYSVLENLICEFYSILVNRNGVIPPLETPSIVPEAYKEMSAASRHLYHYLVARDMQHIVSLLGNRYRDM
ncbi:uncharacterized protein LOC128179500 [Crassostrea angulata]|uniref:uncharacterized protein LOC128179500 n=1 Tax=Magallana angulata TaxID=2784310 RepID=UPI0005C3637B|nr:uncharacterized protein LOC128179500 [Crassostrea angulata]|eukprot:XP_011432517.1 PREDICTED: uncharacterized protein LOC105331847 [Crassostrea gigas]